MPRCPNGSRKNKKLNSVKKIEIIFSNQATPKSVKLNSSKMNTVVADTVVADAVVANKKPKGIRLAKPVSELKVNFDALGWVRELSPEEARLLQDRFNALCVAGDMDAVKEMWKQDRSDIGRSKFAKNVINNLVIDKNTVLLTNDKKLAKWLENNRVDKKYE